MMTFGKFAKLITLDCAYKKFQAKKAEAVFGGARVPSEHREHIRKTVVEFTFKLFCEQLVQNGYRIV